MRAASHDIIRTNFGDKVLKMISDFMVFLAVSVCLHNGLGFAFNIAIVPDRVNGLVPNDVSITCRLDASDTDVTEAVYVDVFRGEKAIAVFRHDLKLTIAEGSEKQFKAQGEMPKSIRDSYLTVVVSNPGMEDLGEYACVLYYLDDTSVLKEKITKANLTVTNEEVKSALRYLVNELSALKTELSLERKKSRELQGEIQQIQKEDNTTVTFTAYGTTSSLARGNVIVFNDVTTNEGQGYNGSTGVFTTPVAGYYVFHISIALPNRKYMIFDLKSSNGQKLPRMAVGDADWYDGDGGTCLAKLETGEEIKPVVRFISGIPTLYHYETGDRFNYFSGYLFKLV